MKSVRSNVVSDSPVSAGVMEQLGGLDAAFLLCETPTMHMHVCALMILDTSTMRAGYSFETIRSMLLDRLPAVSAVSRKLAWPPLHLSRPFWVDAGDLDIDDHLHRITLDAPGDERTLGEALGRIASQPLARDRPLWEAWVIDGLADEHVGLFVKVHHAAIDGVTGANVLMHLCDLEPVHDFASAPVARSWEVRPRRAELLARSIASRVREPFDLIGLIPTTAWRLVLTWRRLAHDAGKATFAAPIAAPFAAPRVPFNAPLTAKRSAAYASISLAEVKRVRAAAGVKINDVVTATVGGALRRYLTSSGDLPSRTLTAAVPVSVHGNDDPDDGNTRVSVMFSLLGTDEVDPIQRLHSVAASNMRAKEIQRAVGADTLLRWSDHLWPNVFALGTRLYVGLHLSEHHRAVHNMILSNVPGPPVPIYVAGAHVVGIYPLGPLMEGAALNITVLSLEDRIGFGISSCPDVIPQVWDIADALTVSFDELVAAIDANEPPSSAVRDRVAES